MKKVFRPNSGYYIFCCILMCLVLVSIIIMGWIEYYKNFYFRCMIYTLILIFVLIISILVVTRLKFVFYDDYFIIQNGTYGDHLKKKDKIIYYNKLKDICYIDTSIGVPHIILRVGSKKILVNTILFSNKKALEMLELIKSKIGIRNN